MTDQTYELEIAFIGAEADRLLQKEYLTAWLVGKGFDTFVEGIVDHLDLFPDEYEDWQSQGPADTAPVLLHSFDKRVLEQLSFDVECAFASHVRCTLRSQSTQSWQEGWKESFASFACGSFQITPPWETVTDPTHALIIDPGLAFGTGQHATTQLCLLEIETLAGKHLPGERGACLDVGCGSGILSIAAAKLGFDRVEACDIDSNAVTATTHNAELNGVSIHVKLGSIHSYADEPKAFACIVANILFPVLQQILPELLACLAPKGTLLLSGIITEQVEPLVTQATALGLALTGRQTQGDWEVLVFS